jgi:hypothetical protein
MQKLDNVVAEYDYYTLEQARELLEKENRIRKAKAKRKRRYYLKQKVLGLVLALIGTTLLFVCDGEAGFPGVCLVLLGLAVVFTKERLL